MPGISDKRYLVLYNKVSGYFNICRTSLSLLLFSFLSNEELEQYLNDEDAVVLIDQYISKLDVVSYTNARFG